MLQKACWITWGKAARTALSFASSFCFWQHWVPWGGLLAHQASAQELLQLDTYISFSSWSLDASSCSTCSCCWARLSSWDVLSSSLSSSWLVSFSLVFSTLVSSLPLRSCVHWCSNWVEEKRTESITADWGILVLRISVWVLEVSWAGSYFKAKKWIKYIWCSSTDLCTDIIMLHKNQAIPFYDWILSSSRKHQYKL